jgi:hypothetical protein
VTDVTGTVHDFKQKGKSKNKQKEPAAQVGDEDMPLPLKQRMVVRAMMQKESVVPPFKQHFRVYLRQAGDDQEGDPQVIEVDPKTRVCKKTKLASVARAIARHLEFLPNFCFTDSQIDATAKLWLKLVPMSEEPAPFLFKGEKGYFKGDGNKLCFNRVPWDPDSSVPRPNFNMLFPPNMINRKCMMAFLGSNFVNGSYDQQYLVIRGEGGDGKGSLIRLLEKIMGAGSIRTIMRTPADDNKHVGMDFDGKKLVCFSDLRKPEFLMSDIIMGITGGDTLHVDPKGRDPYNSKSRPKIMAMINCPFVIPDNRSQRRRAIYAEMPHRSPEDLNLSKEVEDKLWDEAPGIIGEALDTYFEMCPTNKEMIKVPKEVWEHLDADPAVANGDMYQDILDEYFTVQPADTPKNDQYFVTAETFTREFLEVEFGKSRTKQRPFRKWLKTKHGIESELKWREWEIGAKPTNIRVYNRLGFKMPWEPDVPNS